MNSKNVETEKIPNYLALDQDVKRIFVATPLLGYEGLLDCSNACVDAIRRDIQERIGLRDAWSQIADGVKAEILSQWSLMLMAAIGAALKTDASKERASLSDGPQTKPDNHAPVQ
jgi:hypothetical protein